MAASRWFFKDYSPKWSPISTKISRAMQCNVTHHICYGFYKILNFFKNWPKKLIFWLLFGSFSITPCYAFVVTPQFLYQVNGIIEIHNRGKFHLYSISGCEVKKFEMFSWWWSIHEMAHFWALTAPNVLRFCSNLQQSYYSRRVRHCFKKILKIQICTEMGRSQSLHFFKFLSNFDPAFLHEGGRNRRN